MSRKERAIILEFLVHEHIHPKKKRKITMKNSAVTLSTESPRFTIHPPLKKKKEKKNPN